MPTYREATPSESPLIIQLAVLCDSRCCYMDESSFILPVCNITFSKAYYSERGGTRSSIYSFQVAAKTRPREAQLCYVTLLKLVTRFTALVRTTSFANLIL
jgi:hypothetical protein